MSTDTHRKRGTRLRCEAATSDVIRSQPCVHQASPSVDRRSIPGPLEDPAVLIGLTMALVRQGLSPNDLVTDPVLLRLRAFADRGDPACRLLVAWLKHRNRNLRHPKTAIIAAETGDRADG